MFPWVDGFRWTVTHIVFLSLFFAALLTVCSTVACAVIRTTSDFRGHHATDICWHEQFQELPEAERHCRHELAGRVESRVCDNAFDCGSCTNYPQFASLESHPPEQVGVGYSDNLLYHRGHTWVRPEWDGTFSVGLDEFAERLIGDPDKVDLPKPCDEVEMEGVAWKMVKNGYEIFVRAPLSGTVIATGGPESSWYVRLLPHGPVSLRHLLREEEVAGWLASEMDRLHKQTSAGAYLADGGTLMPQLMDALPQADWDAILAATFLES